MVRRSLRSLVDSTNYISTRAIVQIVDCSQLIITTRVIRFLENQANHTGQDQRCYCSYKDTIVILASQFAIVYICLRLYINCFIIFICYCSQSAHLVDLHVQLNFLNQLTYYLHVFLHHLYIGQLSEILSYDTQLNVDY